MAQRDVHRHVKTWTEYKRSLRSYPVYIITCTYEDTLMYKHTLWTVEGDSYLHWTHQSPSARTLLCCSTHFPLCIHTHIHTLWPADLLPGPQNTGQEVSFTEPMFSLETLRWEADTWAVWLSDKLFWFLSTFTSAFVKLLIIISKSI